MHFRNAYKSVDCAVFFHSFHIQIKLHFINSFVLMHTWLQIFLGHQKCDEVHELVHSKYALLYAYMVSYLYQAQENVTKCESLDI